MRGSTKPIFLICLLGLYLVSSGIIELNLGGSVNLQTQGSNLNSNEDPSNVKGKKYGMDMTFEQYKDQFGKFYATAQE